MGKIENFDKNRPFLSKIDFFVKKKILPKKEILSKNEIFSKTEICVTNIDYLSKKGIFGKQKKF